MKNKNKFLKLVSDEKTDTIEMNNYRISNRDMLRESQDISLKILMKMGNANIDKGCLAKILNINNDEVDKFLSGKYNLTLKDIVNIQNKLDIPILYNYKK